MNIFKYKKYVLGVLILVVIFTIVMAMFDNMESKTREMNFPGGFLNSEPGLMPHGKYATTDVFAVRHDYDNGYASLLPDCMKEKKQYMVGVNQDSFGLYVSEEKSIVNISSDELKKLFISEIPDNVFYDINHTEMTIYRDETGYFGYNEARYICGYRTSKVSIRKQEEYGFLMAVQTGNDVICFYVVVTDEALLEDAAQYLQDMSSMMIYLGDGEEKIIGDGMDIDDEPLENYSYKDAIYVDQNEDTSSSAKVIMRCPEDVAEGNVSITWTRLEDDVQISVYDTALDRYLELSEISTDGGYARFHFVNSGGEFVIIATSKRDIGKLEAAIE